MNDGNNLRR